MTSSSAGSRPLSTESASLVASCSTSEQCQPRRSVNPPPNRLDFEPLQNSSTNVKGVVYMLHGWAQNVHVFSNRAKKLTKRLNKAGYKVIFLQGPHRLPPVEGTLTVTVSQLDSKCEGAKDNSVFSREYAYAWFLYDATSSSEPSVLKPSSEGDFRGMDVSLSFLQNEIQTDRAKFLHNRSNHKDEGVPPFFLLGFSQGAVLVHKVATLACERSDSAANDNPWKTIQKCILVSGFSFTSLIYRDLQEPDNTDGDILTRTGGEKKNGPNTDNERIVTESCMPSFHVVGNKDSRVSPRLTMELYDLEPCFGRGKQQRKNSRVLWEHDRGHVLPQDLDFCNRLLEFLSTA